MMSKRDDKDVRLLGLHPVQYDSGGASGEHSLHFDENSLMVLRVRFRSVVHQVVKGAGVGSRRERRGRRELADT